ncbi:serine hydrolase-like protein [Pectinophora gossypiella]|uniref:serine hydrolase-like protein n=1 Tax=Pectinophora gossypiella TaxID=13191 RepID=UPI00214F5494|nr:serine hydrolase-like protein [Pectinophora gossypiella]XP_049883463.1 serine hydrolase-like protein [Pectinophora gossypiella]
MKSTIKFSETEIRIKVPWGNIAALTWGDHSKPPVLLCHGMMDVCSGFRPLVALLPQVFFYVSIELPGNGKSEQFPKQARYTTADYVPVVLAVKKHFNWDHFIYIGHSLGAVVGKYFDIAYPGVITRIVELDPVPLYNAWAPRNFNHWYHTYYGDYYQEDTHRKYNGPAETAPKYTYEKALDLMMNFRGLTKEGADHVLERSLEPAEDGLFRFTYDQRQKKITLLPLSPEYMKDLYTSVSTPTLTILSSVLIELGAYHDTPFVQDPGAWPNKNYTVKVVTGGHDVHINNPELLVDDVAKFLLEVKAKL